MDAEAPASGSLHESSPVASGGSSSGGSGFGRGSVFHRRYQIVAPIDLGGSGVVYEARDLNTDRAVALKVMHSSLVTNARLRRRFLAEGKVTAAIDSEHVVRVTDAGFDGAGVPFVVMELLRGEQLEAHLARVGRLSPRDVCLLARQAAFALEKIHAQGIVHRDFTPRNLFLTRRDDGRPWLKVLDFGASKVISAGSVWSGLVGSPRYMAPEQIRCGAPATPGLPPEKIGPACDLYALAHVVYTLLVGEAYWERADLPIDAHLDQIAHGTVEPATDRARAAGVILPEAFDPWFSRATAISPQDRFESGAIMVRALRLALGFGRSIS
ncbi:MAG: serine/threonine-protein kinase [Minicystis sp.]